MEKYCLRTRVVDEPSIMLYYAGMEGDNTLFYAPNALATTSIDKAMEFDENEAIKLCAKLNQDKEALLKCEFTEFEVIKKANSD